MSRPAPHGEDLPLSVLDLVPVPSGTAESEALHRTIDLAREAERLGFSRYWIAEHHSTAGLASAAPEVLIGQVAGATSALRVGAGGVMLPNHAPLRVAETFRSLEALFPGRIDLGLGRAPGADPVTAFALRRSQGGFGGEDFTGQIAELLAYARDGFPDDHPFRHVRAVPSDRPLPPLWILGTGYDSAELAAALGVGYAFARHLGPKRAARALDLYRERFEPSPTLSEPRTILAASVVCAPTRQRAEELAASLGLWVVRARQGRASDLPTPEEALAYDYDDREAHQLERYRRAQVVGDPDAVRDELASILRETGADELMVTTSVHDHAERVRSYELLAGALRSAPAMPAA